MTDSWEFNRNPLQLGVQLEDPDGDTIKTTPSLWNASLDDAARFGGELTRHMLQACPIVGDRKYVTVDTKIHMLMRDMLPAIPGWHTDGAPRDKQGQPIGPDAPSLTMQQHLDLEGHAPRFHLLVTGRHCCTKFWTDTTEMSFGADVGYELYAEMTRQVDLLARASTIQTYSTEPSRWVSWDWWNIHQAIKAWNAGWRFLIRVTESDYLQPQTDLRQIVRLHNPVYLTGQFGW